ncbi:MAG: hypothetical protein KDA24_26040 [Deltaproteobacteria bacterium]|nr:hypothetical protein [Deltaproteobacteria bacterium]
MSPARQRLGLLALSSYVALLAFAAWDGAVRPAFLDDAHAAVWNGLRALRIQPGAALFAGNGANEYKQEHLCPIVLGHSTSPPPGVVDAPSLLWSCDRSPFPFATDSFQHAMARIFESGHFGILNDDSARRRNAEVGYQLVGDYFCHSPQVTEEVAAVSLLLYRSDVSWRTGQRVADVTWEYRWDCTTGTITGERPEPGALIDAVRAPGATQ